MADNRVVRFQGPMNVSVDSTDFPKMADPKGRKLEHGAILKIVTTNICGSDQHIYMAASQPPKAW